MKTLLVIGASRGIGRATAHYALQHGLRVVAFARHASAMPDDHPNLVKIDGDALNAADVTNALTGVDHVAQCLGIPFDTRMLLGPVTLFSQATQILLDAMQNNGPRRLVAVTGFGAGQCADQIHWLQRPAFNLVFGRAYADKSIQEQLIQRSDLDWTIVRPGVLTNSSNTSANPRYAEHEWVNGLTSRATVAKYIVDSLDDHSTFGQAPVLLNHPWF